MPSDAPDSAQQAVSVLLYRYILSVCAWVMDCDTEWRAVDIDVVPDEFIWTVNWLHYLNYEPIARTSSTCYLVRTSNN